MQQQELEASEEFKEQSQQRTLDSICLRFCITLLDHRLMGDIFDSVAIGFLAVLRIDTGRSGTVPTCLVTFCTKMIHRYLPQEPSVLLVYYLWLVLPFYTQLKLLALNFKEPVSPYLWAAREPREIMAATEAKKVVRLPHWGSHVAGVCLLVAVKLLVYVFEFVGSWFG